MRIRVPTANVLDARGLKRILARTKSRFRRFERERDGAKVLIELLKKELGLSIEYDPQNGVVILKIPDGMTTASFFGKTGSYLGDVAEKLGCSVQEAVELSVAYLRRLVEDGHMSPERFWKLCMESDEEDS